MRIGDPTSFALTCVHEPIENDRGWVFGRMCIQAGAVVLGDFDEPACMLNVTSSHLSSVLRRLPSLDEPSFYALNDEELFRLLDRALYEDDDRTNEEVNADASKYFKFDFLTNGGESFDRSKSFVACAGEKVRVVFVQGTGGVQSFYINKKNFVEAINSFLDWLASESKNAG